MYCVLESVNVVACLRAVELRLGVMLAVRARCAPRRTADNVNVTLDQAQIMKLPDRVATIVIGNPLIADASLQSGGILVITGKGYGSTNLLALDRAGKVVMDKTIQVIRPEQPAIVVVVYKGVDRETYSCTPDCAPRITLGDTPAYLRRGASARPARAQARRRGAGGEIARPGARPSWLADRLTRFAAFRRQSAARNSTTRLWYDYRRQDALTRSGRRA